jgi:protein O-GlcNAc transferase
MLGLSHDGVGVSPMESASDANLPLQAAERHAARGDIASALDACREALALDPGSAAALLLTFRILRSANRLQEALEPLDRLAESLLHDPRVPFYRGNVLRDLGRIADAVASFESAIRLDPNYVAAFNNLGQARQRLGDLDGAADAFRRAAELRPGDAPYRINAGTVAEQSGRLDDAEAWFASAVVVAPELAEAHFRRARVLLKLGRLREAAVALEEAIRLKPDFADAWAMLGSVRRALADTDGAASALAETVRLDPRLRAAWNNLGIVRSDQGRVDEALDCFRAAQGDDDCVDAASLNATSALLVNLHFSPKHDARDIFEEHRRFQRRFEAPLSGERLPPPAPRVGNRPLRVGYVSADLREHAVARFALPLLQHHDRTRFQTYCYSSALRCDAMSARCRAAVGHWRDVGTLSDRHLADAIREDEIDILVDLSMHLAGNRILAFARKPAPVQVAYLAYCGTTGLGAIDYRFTDPHLDPPDGDAAVYSERPIWLRHYWCFQAPEESPPVAEPPSASGRPIMFGCLNNFAKASPIALELWRRILAKVPGSRLLLHAFPGEHRDAARRFFEDGGVGGDRIEFQGSLPFALYLESYARIDIALDPTPYAGGTTTCDALWMGVPVVSLRGKTAVGRSGASLLSAIGLSELVTEDAEGYVNRAIALADDFDRLRQLRRKLRSRMLESPLMDAAGFSLDVEAAYDRMMEQASASDASREGESSKR